MSAVAIVAPIVISLQLARHEALLNEEALVRSNAQEVQRRGEKAATQFWSGAHRLMALNAPPCSPQEIELMRQLDVSSSYIQAVGRISGDNLICSSLGTTEPVALGPPTLTSSSGAVTRLKVRLPMAGNRPLTIGSYGPFAFLVDPMLPMDTPTEGPDIAIAAFVASSPTLTHATVHGERLAQSWYRSIAPGTTVVFLDADSVVAVTRSKTYDLAVVTAAPQSYINKHVGKFALLFVPIGMLCGLALAWAVMYFSRMQFSLPSLLRSAARQHEFFVLYQPIVELPSRRWVAAEALVRWRHDGEIVMPDVFIPAAEESGAITLITACVAEMVARDLPTLLSLDSEFHVAINLSAADLRSAATLALLERTLKGSGAQPANLVVEATEHGFLQGEETSLLIGAIRRLGIRVAIDDFGTGYSSLACLQALELDELKIDRSFVETIGTDGATSGVVPHIIEMGHSMGLKMVAEGVETEAQAEFLFSRGVTCAQGWTFGKPMPLKDLHAALVEQRAGKQEMARV